MNASAIIDDNMTLEEKLKAIENAMREKQKEVNSGRELVGLPPVEIDPAELTMCEGCQ